MTNFSRNKWNLLAVCAVFLVVAIILIFVLSSSPSQDSSRSNDQERQQAGDSSLPANTCPEELRQQDGKQVAIYRGQVVNMLREVYDWVQENCDFNADLPRPVFQNLGIIGLKPYDEMTGRAGPFIFDKQAAQQNWGMDRIFFEFGYQLPNGKVLPEITYAQVDADTDVVAMVEGTVFKINVQDESDDFSLEIRFNDRWMVLYDHVRLLQVEEGDEVVAGQKLGKVSLNNDGQTGYTEVAVKEGDGRSKTTDHCPTLLLAPELRGEYQNYFAQLMRDWEAYVEQDVHADSMQVVASCLVNELES